MLFDWQTDWLTIEYSDEPRTSILTATFINFCCLINNVKLDDRAVSVMIGFILIILISMIFISVVQTRIVPGLIKEAEMENVEEITSELTSAGVELILDGQAKIKLKPVNYPKYPLLLTPMPAGYSVYTEDFYITLNYSIRHNKLN